tara:strand:- start:390 stop:623 length:234 start_codon:yes stop_codon:yes gene_type:complete
MTTEQEISKKLGQLTEMYVAHIASARADERARLKEAFKETRDKQWPDEIHCGCLDYCEWILDGKPKDDTTLAQEKEV